MLGFGMFYQSTKHKSLACLLFINRIPRGWGTLSCDIISQVLSSFGPPQPFLSSSFYCFFASATHGFRHGFGCRLDSIISNAMPTGTQSPATWTLIGDVVNNIASVTQNGWEGHNHERYDQHGTVYVIVDHSSMLWGVQEWNWITRDYEPNIK